MNPVANIEKPDVDGQHPLVVAERFLEPPLRFERPGQPVDQPNLVFVAPDQTLSRPTKHGLGNREPSLIKKRAAELLRRFKPPFGGPQRLRFGARLDGKIFGARHGLYNARVNPPMGQGCTESDGRILVLDPILVVGFQWIFRREKGARRRYSAKR